MATSGGSIAGTLLTYKKPKKVNYDLVNIAGEQTQAIQGNIQALPKLQQLAGRVNEFTTDELLKNLEKMYPGYAAMLAKGGDVINQQLSGEIPEDVAKQIRRHSAEKAIGGGYAGSDFAGALEARDLGITSLNITNNALNSASRWLAQVKSGTPQFDVTSAFISPQQRIQVKLHENQMVYQNKLRDAQIDAMPEAWEVALATLFDNIEELGSSALSAYAGGAMGGGGGGGSSMMIGAGAGASGSSMGYGGGSYAVTVDAARQGYSQPASAPVSQPMISPSYGETYGGNPYFPNGGGP